MWKILESTSLLKSSAYALLALYIAYLLYHAIRIGFIVQSKSALIEQTYDKRFTSLDHLSFGGFLPASACHYIVLFVFKTAVYISRETWLLLSSRSSNHIDY